MAGCGVVVLIFYTVLVGADQSKMDYDTIVIGLGSAGTTAATTLARAGRRVLALEAQDRIGGRVNTVPFGDGVVELGAEWIHGTHPSRVYDTAIKNNIRVRSQDLTMDAYTSDGKQANKELVNELIEYCLAQVENSTTDNLPLGEYLTKKVKEHLNETRPSLLEDEDFVENFLDLMDQVVGNYEGSNSWNDVSTFTHYQELEGDQHMSWHRYGYKTFFELLLNTYEGGPGLTFLTIKLNTEVTQITWPHKPLTPVHVMCKNGDIYKANNVIITVSIGVLKERHASLFLPQLPEEKVLAIQRLSMGVVGKVVISYPNKWWPNNNVYWFNQTKDQRDKAVKDNGWVTYFASVPFGSNNTITLWYNGDVAKLVSIEYFKPKRYTTLFVPPLPEEKVLAIQRLSMGVVDKVVISYPNKWWTINNVWFKQTKEEKLKAVKDNGWVTHFASAPYGSSNAITLWYNGDVAKLVSIEYFKLRRHTSLFKPSLPIDKVHAIDNLTIGVMDKIILKFDKPWWPTLHTFFAFLWRREEKKKVSEEDWWITKIFGASTPLGSSNALTLWTSGDTGKLVETLPEDVVKRKCVEVLQRFLGANVTVPEPTGMYRTTWFTNPFTRGSYSYDSVTSMKYPNSRADLGKPLVDSAGVPKVLFAGEATDLTHFSTVHGASDSGYREALRLLPNSKL